jgi:hypothetical protein
MAESKPLQDRYSEDYPKQEPVTVTVNLLELNPEVTISQLRQEGLFDRFDKSQQIPLSFIREFVHQVLREKPQEVALDMIDNSQDGDHALIYPVTNDDFNEISYDLMLKRREAAQKSKG